MLKFFVHFYDTGIKPVALHMLLRLVTSELSPRPVKISVSRHN